MSEENPGFLAPRHRKYLAGGYDGYDFSEHSNKSEFRKEVRKRVTAAQRDWALLNNTDLDILKDLQATTESVGKKYERQSDEKIQTGINAAEAQKDAYLEDSILDVSAEGVEESLQQIEENDSEIRNFVAEAIAKMLTDDGKDMMRFNEAQAERYIEAIYPEKERVLEIAKEEL